MRGVIKNHINNKRVRHFWKLVRSAIVKYFWKLIHKSLVLSEHCGRIKNSRNLSQIENVFERIWKWIYQFTEFKKQNHRHYRDKIGNRWTIIPFGKIIQFFANNDCQWLTFFNK